MADVIGTVPFGIDDAQVELRDPSDGTPSGTLVDLFGATALSVSTESDTQEARGDNRSIRIRRSNKRATGSVSLLAHQPAILAAVGDGVSSTTGVTPNVITTYGEPDTSTGDLYLLYGQAGDGAGATRITVLNATTTAGPNLDWSNEAYSEPSFDFEGTGAMDGANGPWLWKLDTYETETAIVATGT